MNHKNNIDHDLFDHTLNNGQSDSEMQNSQYLETSHQELEMNGNMQDFLQNKHGNNQFEFNNQCEYNNQHEFNNQNQSSYQPELNKYQSDVNYMANLERQHSMEYKKFLQIHSNYMKHKISSDAQQNKMVYANGMNQDMMGDQTKMNWNGHPNNSYNANYGYNQQMPAYFDNSQTPTYFDNNQRPTYFDNNQMHTFEENNGAQNYNQMPACVNDQQMAYNNEFDNTNQNMYYNNMPNYYENNNMYNENPQFQGNVQYPYNYDIFPSNQQNGMQMPENANFDYIQNDIANQVQPSEVVDQTNGKS